MSMRNDEEGMMRDLSVWWKHLVHKNENVLSISSRPPRTGEQEREKNSKK
jgi:hypothetical protein